MKGQALSCLGGGVFLPGLLSRFSGGHRGGDSRMWEIYCEYADIAAGDDNQGRVRARLAALSATAESQGLTGQAAFDGLRRLVGDLHAELMDTRQFSLFYRFVFFMSRERGQKSISLHTAVAVWRLVLTGRFRLLDQWCAFVSEHQRHSISEDTWRQVLEFSRSVHEDLSNYDPEGAWPVLVDDFVDNMYRKASCPSCNSDSVAVCKCDAELVSKLTCEDDSPSYAPLSKIITLPGMAASAGSKRRRKDPKDEAAQAASVNDIAQLLADMPSPLSCKRLKTDHPTVETPDPMEESHDNQLSTSYWGPQGQYVGAECHSMDDEMCGDGVQDSPTWTHRLGSSDTCQTADWQVWTKVEARANSGKSCGSQLPFYGDSHSQGAVKSPLKPNTPITISSHLFS